MSDRYAGGIKAGSTSVSTAVILRKVADSTEMTAVAAGSVTASYQRQGAAVTTFAVSALATPTSAWAAGGWAEKDSTNQPGSYRLDVPDAAFLTGADFVILAVKVATAFVFYERFNLESVGAAEIYATIATRQVPGVVTGAPTVALFTASGLDATHDNIYTNSALEFTSGVNKGLSNRITGYTASTGSLSFSTNWTVAPAVNDTFVIHGRINS